jgi:hypothetical protein
MIRTGWGLLGPEKVAIERRTRTLGLGATVRAFNNLAVPGMGNVYFGKQLALAVLGIAVAQQVRRDGIKAQNIETANAIEALGCRLAFEENQWASDIRLRGVSKMQGTRIPTFHEARKRSFYVTQPMRMATLQPLMEFGLVVARSERFNAFSIAEQGQHLVDVLCDSYPSVYYSQNVFQRLCGWVSGDGGSLWSLTKPLSPLEPLPHVARDLLRGCVIRGDGPEPERRRAALVWVERCAREDSELTGSRPSELDDAHWLDVEAGGLFFEARNEALSFLDAVETHMGNQDIPRLSFDKPLPQGLSAYSSMLIERAQAFIDLEHDPSPEREATRFCRECLDEGCVVEHLVRRDDRVLRLGTDAVIPGPAYRGNWGGGLEADPGEEEESAAEGQIQLPGTAGILSPRIGSLLLFAIDLQGKLSEYLAACV